MHQTNEETRPPAALPRQRGRHAGCPLLRGLRATGFCNCERRHQEAADDSRPRHKPKGVSERVRERFVVPAGDVAQRNTGQHQSRTRERLPLVTRHASNVIGRLFVCLERARSAVIGRPPALNARGRASHGTRGYRGWCAPGSAVGRGSARGPARTLAPIRGPAARGVRARAPGSARDIFPVSRSTRRSSCPSISELVAGEEPLGAVAGAAGLDVGGLAAGLPAAGDDDGAVDGRALLAVDVLGVGETQAARGPRRRG